MCYVQRFSWFIDSWEEWLKAEKRQRITLPQVRAVERQMRNARAIAPYADTRRPVKYKNRRSDSVTVIGTTDQFQFTKGISVGEGRFMTASEAHGGRPVCVLGLSAATNLFPVESAIGNKIRLGQLAYEVVGVLEKQGDFFGEFSADNAVIIPLQQFDSSFWHYPDFQIQVKVTDMARLDEAKEELRGSCAVLRLASWSGR